MTVAELEARLFRRLNESSTKPVYYTGAEALAALNEAQRVFTLLTLCLESETSLPVLPGVAFYSLLPLVPNWLLPLRVRIAGTGGKKLSPARLDELDAADPGWNAKIGVPARYLLLGFDLLVVAPTNAVALDLVFARCPALLTSPAQVPEIPEVYHASLVDYAIPALRAKEGGAEFVTSLSYFERFLADAAKLGAYIRARNQAAGYDRWPFELDAYDRSKLVVAMKEQRRSQNGR